MSVSIGLGAGALAGYAGNGVRMDFFEIDEAVIRIAENPQYFTYLSDARARPGTTVRTMAVDGRLGLRAMPEASYDLIVVDAFSSDAIPTHLITREAVVDVHVAPQTARRDRVPRVEPVFQPRAGARADRRRSAVSCATPAMTRTCRPSGPRKRCGRRSGSSSRATRTISASSPVGAAMGAALGRRRSFVDRRLHERAGRARRLRDPTEQR